MFTGDLANNIKEDYKKIFLLLMILSSLMSCTPNKSFLVQMEDDRAGRRNIATGKDELVGENYILVDENFDVQELGENFSGTLVVRHKNGKIKDISTYKNSAVVFQEVFNEKGQLEKKYESTDTGFKLILYENSQITSSQVVDNSSSIMATYAKGIIAREEIVKDTLHSQKQYNENGKLEYVISRVEGDKKIFFQQYGDNDNVSFEYHYYNLNGERIYDGTYTEYFPNGNKKIEKEFIDNVMTGNITVFQEHGGIKLKCSNYEKSTTGLCYTYHDNGRINTKYEFADNEIYVPNGRRSSWYENGNLKEVGVIRNDNLIGKHVSYYENGNKKEETNYNEEGIVDGQYKLYHENGQLKYIMNYINGNKDGLFKQYFENGNISYEMHYKNDKLNGRYIQFFQDGRVRQEGSYKNGMKDGLFVTRDYEGKIIATTAYKNGVPLEEEKSGEEMSD